MVGTGFGVGWFEATPRIIRRINWIVCGTWKLNVVQACSGSVEEDEVREGLVANRGGKKERGGMRERMEFDGRNKKR